MTTKLLQILAEGLYIGLVASVAVATVYTTFVLSILLLSLFQ